MTAVGKIEARGEEHTVKYAERQLFKTEAHEAGKMGRGKRPSRSKKLVSGLNHQPVNEEIKNASSVVSIAGMI